MIWIYIGAKYDNYDWEEVRTSSHIDERSSKMYSLKVDTKDVVLLVDALEIYIDNLETQYKERKTESEKREVQIWLDAARDIVNRIIDVENSAEESQK